jgi:hypothetical protein
MAVVGLTLAVGCGEDVDKGVQSKLDPAADAPFYEAPFPIDGRARPDGSLRVADFPNPAANAAVTQLTTLLEEGTQGFSLNGAILVPFDGPVDATRLPADAAQSLLPESNVYLVNLGEGTERYGQRVPIEVSFKAAAETFSPENLLVALPFQGIVLEPETRYGLVVRRLLGDDQGRALYASEALRDVLQGFAPGDADGAALAEALAPLLVWLDASGIPRTDVAAATVFTTGEPLGEMDRFVADVAARPAPTLSAVRSSDVYEGYCVIAATTSLPVFQRPEKPYRDFPSGQLVRDEDGALLEQGRDEFEIILTIPHRRMPYAGFPLVLYAAGAEGSARQVIDRTAESRNPDEGLGPPGQGPARTYAARGVSALGFPAPLTWDRNPRGDGGLLDFWNVENLGAFRDNIRQGILDITSLIALAKTAVIDEALCPEAGGVDGTFYFDPEHLVLHGHSTGSTIGSAAIALEPDLEAAVLSGAGGSWIYNVTMAESPFVMRTVAGVLLGYQYPDVVDAFDPAVTLFQTALESIEVMNWGRATVARPLAERSPKQLLLIEGVIDSYHLPRMVNAYAMSAGLDLVEPAVEDSAALDYQLVGRGVLPAPLHGNIDGIVTAATIQRQQNDQDGHYVAFEFDDVKYRYGCFVDAVVRNESGVVALPSDDAMAACP